MLRRLSFSPPDFGPRRGLLPTIPPFPTFTTSTTQTDEPEASTEAHPTEARIKQKEKLKAEKEAGIKPRKIKKHIEPGNDDCGEDLSGLGKDAAALCADIIPEIDAEEDEDEEMFINIPPPSKTTTPMCIAPSLRYATASITR